MRSVCWHDKPGILGLELYPFRPPTRGVLGRWSCQRQGLEEGRNPEDFYEDRCCQDIFQNFLATITSRVNTITGTAYRCCPHHAPPMHASAARKRDRCACQRCMRLRKS